MMKQCLFCALSLLIAQLSPAASAVERSVPAVGAVYAMTNAVDGNEIVVYNRAADGLLTFSARYATGGDGGFAGDPVDALGSQNSLILSANKRWLLAVNAGSDQISVFRVSSSGLALRDVVDSGGDFPVSLALDGDLVYVLNAGSGGTLSGFILSERGELTPLEGSTRALNADSDSPPLFVQAPAQIGFSPDGDWLLVTLKEQHRIDAFALDDNGLPAATPVMNPVGTLPFGFMFNRRGRLLVAEPFGAGAFGQPGAGAVSSYTLTRNGRLLAITDSAPNAQTTTCWVVASPNGRFVYTTNNGDSTVSAYRVGRDGNLVLTDGVAAVVDSRPVDLALTDNGRFLYTLNAGSGTIAMFEVERSSGELLFLGEVDGLPEDDGAVGIAVR